MSIAKMRAPKNFWDDTVPEIRGVRGIRGTLVHQRKNVSLHVSTTLMSQNVPMAIMRIKMKRRVFQKRVRIGVPRSLKNVVPTPKTITSRVSNDGDH